MGDSGLLLDVTLRELVVKLEGVPTASGMSIILDEVAAQLTTSDGSTVGTSGATVSQRNGAAFIY